MPRPAPRLAIALLALIFCLAASAPPAWADPPATLSYQAKIYDALGHPLTGVVNLAFSLYDAAEGGTALWSEAHSGVTATDGIVSVTLGSVTPLGLDFDQPYWLGIAVGSDPEMTPRQALASAPYARQAGAVAWGNVTNKPAIEGPYGNRLTVAQSGGQFTSIQAALDSITDASASNPYLVWVGPGEYAEAVTTPAYVSVQGSGQGVTVVAPPAGVLHGWTMGDHCRISDLTVRQTQGNLSGEVGCAIWVGDGKTAHIQRVDVEVNWGSEPITCGIWGGDGELNVSQVNITVTSSNETLVSGLFHAGDLSANRVNINVSGTLASAGVHLFLEPDADYLLDSCHIQSEDVALYMESAEEGTPLHARLRDCRLKGDYIFVWDQDTHAYMSGCELDGTVDTATHAKCVSCFDGDYSVLGSNCQ